MSKERKNEVEDVEIGKGGSEEEMVIQQQSTNNHCNIDHVASNEVETTTQEEIKNKKSHADGLYPSVGGVAGGQQKNIPKQPHKYLHTKMTQVVGDRHAPILLISKHQLEPESEGRKGEKRKGKEEEDEDVVEGASDGLDNKLIRNNNKPKLEKIATTRFPPLFSVPSGTLVNGGPLTERGDGRKGNQVNRPGSGGVQRRFGFVPPGGKRKIPSGGPSSFVADQTSSLQLLQQHLKEARKKQYAESKQALSARAGAAAGGGGGFVWKNPKPSLVPTVTPLLTIAESQQPKQTEEESKKMKKRIEADKRNVMKVEDTDGEKEASDLNVMRKTSDDIHRILKGVGKMGSNGIEGTLSMSADPRSIYEQEEAHRKLLEPVYTFGSSTSPALSPLKVHHPQRAKGTEGRSHVDGDWEERESNSNNHQSVDLGIKNQNEGRGTFTNGVDDVQEKHISVMMSKKVNSLSGVASSQKLQQKRNPSTTILRQPYSEQQEGFHNTALQDCKLRYKEQQQGYTFFYTQHYQERFRHEEIDMENQRREKEYLDTVCEITGEEGIQQYLLQQQHSSSIQNEQVVEENRDCEGTAAVTKNNSHSLPLHHYHSEGGRIEKEQEVFIYPSVPQEKRLSSPRRKLPVEDANAISSMVIGVGAHPKLNKEYHQHPYGKGGNTSHQQQQLTQVAQHHFILPPGAAGKKGGGSKLQTTNLQREQNLLTVQGSHANNSNNSSGTISSLGGSQNLVLFGSNVSLPGAGGGTHCAEMLHKFTEREHQLSQELHFVRNEKLRCQRALVTQYLQATATSSVTHSKKSKNPTTDIISHPQGHHTTPHVTATCPHHPIVVKLTLLLQCQLRARHAAKIVHFRHLKRLVATAECIEQLGGHPSLVLRANHAAALPGLLDVRALTSQEEKERMYRHPSQPGQGTNSTSPSVNRVTSVLGNVVTGNSPYQQGGGEEGPAETPLDSATLHHLKQLYFELYDAEAWQLQEMDEGEVKASSFCRPTPQFPRSGHPQQVDCCTSRYIEDDNGDLHQVAGSSVNTDSVRSSGEGDPRAHHSYKVPFGEKYGDDDEEEEDLVLMGTLDDANNSPLFPHPTMAPSSQSHQQNHLHLKKKRHEELVVGEVETEKYSSKRQTEKKMEEGESGKKKEREEHHQVQNRESLEASSNTDGFADAILDSEVEEYFSSSQVLKTTKKNDESREDEKENVVEKRKNIVATKQRADTPEGKAACDTTTPCTSSTLSDHDDGDQIAVGRLHTLAPATPSAGMVARNSYDPFVFDPEKERNQIFGSPSSASEISDAYRRT